MPADAIALFRPRAPEKLKPFLDLDDENEESDGLYAEELEDGAVLVHTFQPFEVFERSPSEAREWLAQFGDALPDVHDDARGLLFFPDTCELDGTTYDAVVAEVSASGLWIATSLVDEDEGEEEEEGAALDVNALLAGGLPPIDMETLQAFAGQLLGQTGVRDDGADDEEPARPATSFEVAKLFEGMQQHLLEALGVQEATARDGADAPRSDLDDEAAAAGDEDDDGSGDDGSVDAGDAAKADDTDER